MHRRALKATVVVAGLVVCGVAGAVGPADAATSSDPVDRVLVISVPTLSWEEVDAVRLPHLNALPDESAVADLSTRGLYLDMPSWGYLVFEVHPV